MTNAPFDFGVQSYCFRNFRDNREVADMVRQIGVGQIELCDVHADFQDPEAFAGVVEIYRQAGVQVVSIGVQTIGSDLERVRRWFECLKVAGARHMSVHFRIADYLQAIPATAALAEEFDVRVGIHCHGGWHFGGAPEVLSHLLMLGGPRIGVNIDTAWCMQIGPRFGKPSEWVRERFAGRVYGVHLKDFVFERNGQWQDVIVGSGNLDLSGFLLALQETDFDGMAAVEYEADPADPVPALRQCVDRIRTTAAEVAMTAPSAAGRQAPAPLPR